MKQKTRCTIAAAVVLTLALAGCGSEAAASPTSTPAASPVSTSVPSSEPSVVPSVVPTVPPTVTPSIEPSAEPTVTSSAAPSAEPSATPESTAAPGTESTATPSPTSQVDYSGDMTGWMYTPERDDALVNLLITIDSTPYGVAGATLQQANSAVCLMKLTMDESDKVSDAVSTYLSEMNDTQKDYFSFQWQQAFTRANALLDGTMDAGILEDSGNDLDLKTVDSEKLTVLNETVTGLLRSAGVSDQWKNQTDVEFFAVAS